MKDLILPEELRPLFKKPFGKLLKGKGLKPAEEVKSLIKGGRVIVIGDETYKNIRKVGIEPSLGIVDFKVKRKRIEGDIEGGIRVKNPQGMITAELWDAIRESIDDKQIIVVEGEEDLAVIPCILEADWDDVVLYGQPDEGIVFINITEEVKEKASMYLKFMEVMQS
ncbi:MAG: GTP-dependent dephospho-CoA kinase family protein [Candidatus Hydrothermarchaeales archaeon]